LLLTDVAADASVEAQHPRVDKNIRTYSQLTSVFDDLPYYPESVGKSASKDGETLSLDAGGEAQRQSDSAQVNNAQVKDAQVKDAQVIQSQVK